MLGDARRAEIIGQAANRHDQRVIAEHPRRDDLLAVLVVARRHIDLPFRAVEADHLADAVAIVTTARVGDELDRIGFAVD